MGSATILVVDDERKIRDLVRSYLELEGYSVLVADSGERALESASRPDRDLVVFALGLPDLTSEEVARTPRTTPPTFRSSCSPPGETTGSLPPAGPDDYLGQPRVEATGR